MSHHSHRKKPVGEPINARPFSVKVQSLSRIAMDFILCAYLILIIAVLPFYFQDGYAYIATDKAMLFRRIGIRFFQVILPVLAVYLVSSLAVTLRGGGSSLSGRLRGLWREFGVPELFMGIYGAALVLSYLCSNYREEALWGAGNGWYMGFVPQLMLLAACFLAARFWKPRQVFLWLMFGVSAVVFLLGYLDRFGFYIIEMNMRSPGFISTIGNINWYCGYVVTVLFVGVGLLWGGTGSLLQRVLLGGYVLLGFGTLMTQGSASGLFALAVMMLVLFAFSAGNGERMFGFWLITSLWAAACLVTSVLNYIAPTRMTYKDEFNLPFISGPLPIFTAIGAFAALRLFYGSCRRGTYPEKLMKTAAKSLLALAAAALSVLILMITVNTIRPGSLGRLSELRILTFDESWGSNRGITWEAAVLSFREQDILHKLTGVGPDAMAAYLYQDSGDELVGRLTGWFGQHVRLTNAHNEWLSVLVNTGILGLVGFGGMMVSAIWSFLKKGGQNAVCMACGLALMAYTANNIFSFQQTAGLSTMTAVLGMGLAFMREAGSADKNTPQPVKGYEE